MDPASYSTSAAVMASAIIKRRGQQSGSPADVELKFPLCNEKGPRAGSRCACLSAQANDSVSGTGLRQAVQA